MNQTVKTHKQCVNSLSDVLMRKPLISQHTLFWKTYKKCKHTNAQPVSRSVEKANGINNTIFIK